MSEAVAKVDNFAAQKRSRNGHQKGKAPYRKRRKPFTLEEPPKPTCAVCSGADKVPSYKCPKCRAFYCSVACCKEHKNICPGKPPEDESSSSNSISASKKSGIFSSLNLTQLQPFHKRDSSRKNEEEDSTNDGWKLTDEMKEATEKSAWLRSQLQSEGGLRDAIRQIVASQNLDALQEVKDKFPAFQMFLDKLLVVSGILEREQDIDETEIEPLDEWLDRDWSQDPTPPQLSLKPLQRKMPEFQPVNLSSSSDEEDEDDGHDSSSSEDEESSSDESVVDGE